MIRDIYKVKMKFMDIQRELSIRPGANIDETLKSALLQEKGYVTSNNLQKNLPSSTSENLFRIKQEPNMSIQLRKNGQNWNNRTLQDNKSRISGPNSVDKLSYTVRVCYFCGIKFTQSIRKEVQQRGQLITAVRKRAILRNALIPRSLRSER